ncbi:hypothetical protein AL552_03130 [Vibrio diabolicus]|nr:hypothetical protein AL552_03130 [Vibrio diabolicus]
MIGMIAISSGKSTLGKKRLFIFYDLITHPVRARKQPELKRVRTIPMLRILFGNNRHHAKVCMRGASMSSVMGKLLGKLWNG